MASAKPLDRAEIAPVRAATIDERDEPGTTGGEPFEAIFHRHYPTVYRVLVRLVGSAEEAEDLAQEVFLRLHQRREPLPAEELAPWLYRVALNAGFNAARSRRRALQRLLRWARLEPDLTRGVASPEEEVARRDEAALVRRALGALRERDRAVLVLRASGVSYSEIAAATGIKPSSVGTTLARAERALRRHYEALQPPRTRPGEQEGGDGDGR